MKKLLIIAISLICMTTSGFANQKELSRIEKITPILMEFIARNGNYDVTNVPPITKYVFKSYRELNQIFYGSDEKRSDFNVMALYQSGVIFLPNDFEVKTGAYFLIHELVHHVQFHSDREFKCIAAMEKDAYDIMDKYVIASGNGTKSNPIFTALLQCRLDR